MNLTIIGYDLKTTSKTNNLWVYLLKKQIIYEHEFYLDFIKNLKIYYNIFNKYYNNFKDISQSFIKNYYLLFASLNLIKIKYYYTNNKILDILKLLNIKLLLENYYIKKLQKYVTLWEQFVKDYNIIITSDYKYIIKYNNICDLLTKYTNDDIFIELLVFSISFIDFIIFFNI